MDTYDQILNRMKENYSEITGSIIDDASDIAIRMAVLAGEIYSSLVNIEWVKNQMFVQTASGIYLDYHAQQRDIKRKSATYATGKVAFSVYAIRTYSIEIPKGTIIATDSVNPIKYVTDSTVVLKAGQKAVNAQITALEAGSGYNTAAETVTVMITPPAGIDYVSNTRPISGGSDQETDESLRRRIIDSFSNVSNGTNCAYYKSLAMQVDGVHSAGVVPCNRGAGTVDIFIAQDGLKATADQINQVQEIMDINREINIDISVSSATPVRLPVNAQISIKDGFELNSVFSDCREALSKYFSSLNVGQSVYLNDIVEAIYHVEGVNRFTIENPASAVTQIKGNEFAVLGDTVLQEGY